MIIPKGMTKEEVLSTIELIVGRIAPRYTFNGYEVDDIKQESFIICMDALNRYDGRRPLENFLSVHLSNRLKNFIRDNYFLTSDSEKSKVLNPAQLSYEDNLEGDIDDADQRLDTQDLKGTIDRNLPVEYRSDYLKMINNVHVQKKRKEEIMLVIKNILKDTGYEDR